MMTTSIRTKLVVSVGIPVLLIYTALGALGFRTLKHDAIEAERQLAQAVADDYVSRFEGGLNRISQVADSAAAFLSLHPELSEAQIRSLIEANIAQRPLISGACVAFAPRAFDASRELFAPYGCRSDEGVKHLDIGADAYDYTTWEWFASPQEQDKGIWTEPYFDEGAGNILMCTYAAPFYDAEGAFRGVATVDISLESLQRAVGQVEEEGAELIVLSRAGRFITHPNPDLVMKSLAERTKEINQPELLAQFEDLIRQGETTFLRFGSFPAGQPHWACISPIECAGWTLAAVFSEADVLAPVYAALKRQVGGFVVGLGVTLLAILIVGRWVTQPISKLEKAVRVLGTGNLEARVSGVHTRDELGRLAVAFNDMMGQLNEHVDALARESAARQKVQSDLKIAQDIQQGMLPKAQLEIPGFEVAGWNKPADETGGDYYDWLQLPDGRWAISVADATGHGIGPALVAAFCRAYSRASLQSSESLDACVNHVNDLIHVDMPMGRFVTLVITVVDPGSGRIEQLSAGHAPILVYHAAEKRVECISADGIPAGIMTEADYGPARRLDLSDGDLLVLPTDGFFEWANAAEEQFGIDRLCDTIAEVASDPPEEIIAHVRSRICAFVGDRPQDDDLTMVVIKRTGS